MPNSDTKTHQNPPKLTLNPADKTLTLAYEEGLMAVFPHAFLRVYSPLVKLPITDDELLAAENAEILSAEAIGDEGVLLTFSDGLSGLCLWKYLSELAQRQAVLVPLFRKQLAQIKEKRHE